MFQTRRLWILLILLFGLGLPSASQAFVTRSGGDVNFKQGDQLSGTTYAVGQQITIDTPLPGDLICAGRSVFINQPVQGDVICAAENITIRASVGGAVRLIGSKINLDDSVSGNAMLFGSDLVISEKSEIKGETLIAAQFLDSRGRYSQDFYGGAIQAKLYGDYAGLVNLTMADSGDSQSNLQINHGAKLERGLIYRSKLSAQIDPAAEIKGEVIKKDLPINTRTARKEAAAGWLWSKFLRLFMLLVTGIVILSLWPKVSREIADVASHRPANLMLRGLAILAVAPLVIIFTIITIIGLPVAMIVLAIWLILLYIAKLVVGYWLGRRIFPQVKNNIWPFLAGVTILFIVSSFPILGWLISLIATWWGVGAIWYWFKGPIELKK